MSSDEQRMREALGEFGRRFGVTAFVTDTGEVLAEAPMPAAELEPLAGHGDMVCRGDLVRVYFQDGGRPEVLEHDGARVNDYGEDWMNVLHPDGAIHSFSFGARGSFSRRLELVAPASGD